MNIYQEVEDLLESDAASRFRDNFFDKKQLTTVENLNEFWKAELKSIRKVTITEEAALIDSLTESEWLTHFKNIVLNTVVRFKLPR